ncbi:MAG TPA: type II toxin-antitoxin system Phd/YefM family antitoxin [Rhizomicrobium sp.]|nr:type II toxin-antitoxin system Phd/YefM family antitoxin [Rhizomicrobium sp.]
MREINLRDANQQFSKLVREIEETGETVLVMRNGKPAIKLGPVEERAPALSRAQAEAKARLMSPEARFSTPDGWKFNREEIYDEAILRHSVVRKAWQHDDKKVRRRG